MRLVGPTIHYKNLCLVGRKTRNIPGTHPTSFGVAPETKYPNSATSVTAPGATRPLGCGRCWLSCWSHSNSCGCEDAGWPFWPFWLSVSQMSLSRGSFKPSFTAKMRHFLLDFWESQEFEETAYLLHELFKNAPFFKRELPSPNHLKYWVSMSVFWGVHLHSYPTFRHLQKKKSLLRPHGRSRHGGIAANPRAFWHFFPSKKGGSTTRSLSELGCRLFWVLNNLGWLGHIENYATHLYGD